MNAVIVYRVPAAARATAGRAPTPAPSENKAIEASTDRRFQRIMSIHRIIQGLIADT
ncbi:hypothetical protein ACFROC_08325 [Nocardia tengchongensis]|uniref:hypothetical protein n=1 Tax=Nocardia tengchongensis TaxID=2055889 RepID=UPI0036CFF3E4